ncbi:hypothetical protein KOR42_01840 [Thalassoglobus neptunius]|uniref:Uncharacterized protein n=1 Tax=Thalassoglobus neptunius TaxID=1938619 RepID=A0A5C5X2H6_9PLAN|nr:hypothetical protein [Thalassoglobus neptunius]TWT56829.1 hypothetical protein KOR42_01840 [Thalassoglobus neptunius]
MTTLRRVSMAAALLAVGYCCGQAHLDVKSLTAQEGQVGVPDDTANKIREANRSLIEAMDSLRSDGLYESITEGPNAYLILSGGGNAREDLESGLGVDPETFAGLYSGQAVPEIQALLGVDDQGRVTYNDEVVRMYSKSRLQRVRANRIKLTETSF